MSKRITYVINRDAVTFAFEGKSHVVSKVDARYPAVLNALKSNDHAELHKHLRPAKQIIAEETGGMIVFKDDKLYFDGKPLHNVLADRILRLKREGYDISPLKAFLENLMQNPSKRAVDELYTFLEQCDLPITRDGHFIAYKMVRHDFKDIYTGKMDNSPGAVVKMRRNEVDDRKENTCSDGLHFASRRYVETGGYGSIERGHRLVAVKINPRDVVSIPVDYYYSKGRCCEYLVLKELDWNEHLPVDAEGFPFIDEAPQAATPKAGKTAKSKIAPAAPAVSRTYTDADIRKVKRLLKSGKTLTEISTLVGMSRRHVARIRDGEIGAAVAV